MIENLEKALEHDLAQKAAEGAKPSLTALALYCFQNATVASRGAECALVVCKPPAIAEARQAAQLAMQSLEQAMSLLNSMETTNV